MIDWIDAKCRSWGFAKRRLLYAQEKPPQSFSGKLMEEGPGALMNRTARSREVEGFTGDALEVAVALGQLLEARRITDRQFEVLVGHYVARGPVKFKAHKLELSVKRYYDLLSAAHGHLASTMGG